MASPVNKLPKKNINSVKKSPQPPLGGGMPLIIASVIILFAVSVLGVNVFSDVQKIERGEAGIKINPDKLKGEDIELPKTNLNLTTLDDPSAGSPRAKVHIVEFSDFQCPYCKLTLPSVLDIIEEYGDKIHFIYRDFPLSIHPYARKAAEAAECAQDQDNFWPMHNIIFANQSSITVNTLKGFAQGLGLDMVKFNDCLDSGKYSQEVQQDYEDGEKAGVRGTPTFFINGQMIFGAVPLEELKLVIDRELMIN